MFPPFTEVTVNAGALAIPHKLIGREAIVGGDRGITMQETDAGVYLGTCRTAPPATYMSQHRPNLSYSVIKQRKVQFSGKTLTVDGTEFRVQL